MSVMCGREALCGALQDLLQLGPVAKGDRGTIRTDQGVIFEKICTELRMSAETPDLHVPIS